MRESPIRTPLEYILIILSATIQGGIVGGVTGLAAGSLFVFGATKRYPTFKGLTLPFRAFLIASTGTAACTNSASIESLH
jgi:hypothetical protein